MNIRLSLTEREASIILRALLSESELWKEGSQTKTDVENLIKMVALTYGKVKGANPK